MRRLLSIPIALLLLPPPSGSPRSADARTWRVDVRENDGTDLAALMTLRVDGDRWELYSRPGLINGMVSWPKRTLGRLLGMIPPKNTLIYCSGEAVSSGDSVVLLGRLQSPALYEKGVRGSLHGDRLHLDLYWRESDTTNAAGAMDGVPGTPSSPLRDYRAIAARTRDSIAGLVYDASIAAAPNMRKFFARLDAAAAGAMDDIDMVAGFMAAQPLIGISHFGFIRNPKIAATPIDSLISGDPDADVASFVNFSLYGNGTVGYLRVRRWARATPFVQRAFERMDSARTQVLILDLTGNGGGDPTAFTPASHLFRDTVGAGYVLGRPWYAAHQRLPTRADVARFPEVRDEEEARQLLKMVVREGGVHARLVPRAPYFGGKVYLLVDGRTGSASEFLTYLLKATGRAALYGKRTGGAVLTALPHTVGEGFVVTVPEANYFTEDGTRIEGNGIRPHVTTDDPNVAVLDEIGKTFPYASALIRAQISYNRRKFDDAIRYWTEARALTTNESSRRAIDQRIEQARKLKGPD